MRQGDYYTSSAWLSPQERQLAEERERQRREKLHQRRQHRVNLHIDSSRDVAFVASTSDDEHSIDDSQVSESKLDLEISLGAQEPHQNQQVEDIESSTMGMYSIENFELSQANSRAGHVYRAMKQM